MPTKARFQHPPIIFIYELNPEGFDTYYIPADSLGVNLYGALKTIDGLMVNTDKGPKTEAQWKAWGYVDAAMTEFESDLSKENENEQNRFAVQLVPFKLERMKRNVSFLAEGEVLIIRAGTIL